MRINISEYLPIMPEELDAFEKLVESSTELPPGNSFERLLEAKEANDKLTAFQEGKKSPESFGMLMEIFSTAVGKNRFRFADELQVDGSTWNKVILGQNRPDALPARIYVAFAKMYNISFEVIKSALEGSFRLFQSGVSEPGVIYARSDQKTTRNTDVTAAMHELLRKAGRITSTLDQKAVVFFKDFETWMKK